MSGKFEAPRGGARRNPQSGSRQSRQPQQSQPRRSGNQPPRGGSYTQRRKSNPLLPILLILLILLLLAGLGFAAWKILGSRDDTLSDPVQTGGDTLATQDTTPTTQATQPPTETTMPEPEHVVATATVSATGDMLMHKPIITAAQHLTQGEIQRHSNAHRQNGADKLPHGQAEKERFAVGANLLVDFDFH